MDQENRADSPQDGSAKDKVCLANQIRTVCDFPWSNALTTIWCGIQDKKPANPQLTRGKKGKMKKMKDKYAEQDDEERELRMELLGVRIDYVNVDYAMADINFLFCMHFRKVRQRTST